MMNLINVGLIADTAVALGRLITVPAKPASQLRRGVYVFLALQRYRAWTHLCSPE